MNCIRTKSIMGDCVSAPEGAGQDSVVNKEMAKDKKIDKGIKKLLFLGSGGSGKSTLFKQLRSIHGDGYSKSDRMYFVAHIHAQIVDQMKLAIECIEFDAEEELENQMGDEYERPNDFNPYSALSDEAQAAVERVSKYRFQNKINDQMAADCKLLWNEPAIKQIYEDRAITKIEDTSNYFWDKIDQIMLADFVPNETDILLVRYRTTGVIDQKFTIEKSDFHVFDVGGQKSERRKWIHCFDSVTAVIFVTSLSCYDSLMFEDEGNQMVDSLDLFDEICNNEFFKDTSIILFLNKKDLFEEKIKTKSIKLCEEFESFEGDEQSYDETTSYIKDVFVSKNRHASSKTIFTHLTCATDSNNVEKVFNDVQHVVIQNSLVNAGVMGDFDEYGDDTANLM